MQPTLWGKATFGNDSKRNHEIPTKINLSASREKCKRKHHLTNPPTVRRVCFSLPLLVLLLSNHGKALLRSELSNLDLKPNIQLLVQIQLVMTLSRQISEFIEFYHDKDHLCEYVLDSAPQVWNENLWLCFIECRTAEFVFELRCWWGSCHVR